MISGMKTTLNLHDALVTRAKSAAVRESTTLTRLIEEGLMLRLRRGRARPLAAIKDLPVSALHSGVKRGVNDTSNRSLFDAADL